ncbi:MAG: WbuC family cupin fold metalloprotein [Candidatus Aminicenantes bacterium]|nr:WbuC family cupin fold metalloprotein [Candidatus Aminicenantes bacterium]
MKGLIRITKNGHLYAIVLRREFSNPGPNFFTPGEFSQQLGMLIHPKGKVVKRHRHKLVKREIFRTQEVLVLLEGRIRVELFDDDGEKLKTLLMKPGDAILLAQGGHKVKVLEEAKMIEVKQGPYAGFDDKEFF